MAAKEKGAAPAAPAIPKAPRVLERFVATCAFTHRGGEGEPALVNCTFNDRTEKIQHGKSSEAWKEVMIHARDEGHIGVQARRVRPRRVTLYDEISENAG